MQFHFNVAGLVNNNKDREIPSLPNSFFYDFFVSFAMKLLYKYLIIISINLICYYRSIDGDFVFDDSVAILKNRDVYEGEFNRKTFEVGNEGKFGTKLKFFGNF